MYAKTLSMALFGLDAFPVEVEADVSSGLPAFDIVGLPDAAVNEAKDRVRAALKNRGYKFPLGRITVNLAPADRKKSGACYDLAVFFALLSASGQISFDLSGLCMLGELSLDGGVRPVTGVLSMALAARQNGIKELFVPVENAAEAAAAEGISVYGVGSVQSLLEHLSGKNPIAPKTAEPFEPQYSGELDFSDVCGQSEAKRALEIAAAGGHNLLMIGPPGAGKSMLAKRLATILPPLSYEEAVETTKIHSLAGILEPGSGLMTLRPFRSPHHTVSPSGLAGGGSIPRPGDLSLAHNGVLFLDELPEFPRTSMEVLRQPIEDGRITISRAAASYTFPCSVMLVAAMNPCPCGNLGNPAKQCSCTRFAVERYLARVSGPLLDRIDIQIEVPAVEYDQLSSKQRSESSAEIRVRVSAARDIQLARYRQSGIRRNAELSSSDVRKYCALSPESEAFLKNAFERLSLTARAYDKILKIARTVADLSGSADISLEHLAEALSYRSLDRRYRLG